MSTQGGRFNFWAWLGAMTLAGGAVVLLTWASLQDPETRAHGFYGIYVVGAAILLALIVAFAILVATPLFWAAADLLPRTGLTRPLQDIIAGAFSATIAFVASPILYMQTYASIEAQLAQCAIAALAGAGVGVLYWALDVRPWVRARLRA